MSEGSGGSRHPHHGWWPCRETRGHMKINLPLFKDEVTRNAITYQSWWWDLTIYHHTGCQDCTHLPYAIHSLQGYPEELVRSSGIDVTLDDVLTILDEYYNNVKALDTLNQELFQLWMGEKETVLDLGVYLSRHLQILAASFPDRFPPDSVAELKQDCFYGGLPKWLKTMVVYLKATPYEKTYSDYLCAAWETEKEETMEQFHGHTADSPAKPKVMSFFPLRKLKGTQSTKTPAVWLAHLEEEAADDEEGPDSKDPDGTWWYDRGIHGTPCQSCEGCTARRETLPPLQQARTFHQGLSFGEIGQKGTEFKPQRGDSAKEGSLDPSRKGDSAEGTPGWDAQGIGCHTDSLLEFQPFPAMVQGQKCSQGNGYWRELYGPPWQWCANKHHHAQFHGNPFPRSRTSFRPSQQMSHLCGSGSYGFKWMESRAMMRTK